jgi:hypothetical protein
MYRKTCQKAFLPFLAFSMIIPAFAGPDGTNDPRNVCSPQAWFERGGTHEDEIQFVLENIHARGTPTEVASFPVEPRVVRDMTDVTRVRKDISKRWISKLTRFFSRFEHIAEYDLHLTDPLAKNLMIRFTSAVARENKVYDSVFESMSKGLVESNREFSTDLISVYVTLYRRHQHSRWGAQMPVLAEIASAWHGRADKFLEDLDQAFFSESKDHKHKVVRALAEQFYFGHAKMGPKDFVEIAEELVRKGGKGYTTRDLFMDFTDGHSYILGIHSEADLDRRLSAGTAAPQ